MKAYSFELALTSDFDRRFDEIIAFKKVIDAGVKSDADRLRRSLLLILYSHLEGFCVYALREYVKAINLCRFMCKHTSSAIVAGSWHHVFKALHDGDKKCEVFKSSLPDDSELHLHWRRRHFVQEYNRLIEEEVNLSDDVINSESNLKPLVLKRNMFLVGLDYGMVDDHVKEMQMILARRNPIAHGEDTNGVELEDYDKMESAYFSICTRLIDELVDAHEVLLNGIRIREYPCEFYI